MILCVANVARSAQPVELDLSRFRGRVPVELIGRTPFPTDRRAALPADPAGPWLLLVPARHRRGDAALARRADAARDDLPVLVLFDGWTSFFRDRVVPWRIGMAQKVRAQLEEEVLPRYIEAQRWYAAKGEPVRRAALADHAEWQFGKRKLAHGAAGRRGGDAERALFRCRSRWPGKTARKSACAALRLRRSRKSGSRPLSACWATRSPTRPSAARWWRRSARGASCATARGMLRFSPTRAYTELAGTGIAELPRQPTSRAEQQYDGEPGRALVPEGLPAACARASIQSWKSAAS